MKKHLHEITAVESGSIAEECGLEPGDAVASINGQDIQDIFDYQYLIQEDFLRVLILTKDGEECILEIEKEEDEDLGITFASSLMDEYHSCCNKCIFCFIDQMPPGMRDTLYFKDDDSRLSFLQGNYITLTNMSYEDIDRVIRYHLAPVNISVHTTNPGLRCRMLNNRFAGDIMEKLQRFYDAGIPMNSQIVLCKGINDGEELDRTISDLGSLQPYMESLSVVPVGLTRFREGLARLAPFDREDAGRLLDQIAGWQRRFREDYGRAFVHASDEWFILADRPFPPADYYEGFGQIENGVGMMRLLIDEVRERLADYRNDMENIPGDTGKDEICTSESVSRDGIPAEDLITWDEIPSEDRIDGDRIPSEDRITRDGISPKDCISKDGIPSEDCIDGDGIPSEDLITRDGISSKDCISRDVTVSIATGMLAYPSIVMITQEIMEYFPHVSVKVYAIENHFFGEKITVTGLLTGQDIIDQLRGKDLGDVLLLPCNVLKADEPVFLDDITLEELGQTLQVQVNIIQSGGADLVDQIAACGSLS